MNLSQKTKGKRLISKNMVDFATGKISGNLSMKPTVNERMETKCPKCGQQEVDLVYGLGGMGVGQMYFCKFEKCGWGGFDL